MTLFTSFNTGLSALQAQITALHTTGHNVANANTPGFSRQRVEFAAAPSMDLAYMQLGTGVKIAGVVRIVDMALETQLRNARSAKGELEMEAHALENIESIFNELQETDLSSALEAFFNALGELANYPESAAARRQVVETGRALSNTFRFITDRISDAREAFDQQIRVIVDEINTKASDIARLNDEIVMAENGGVDIGAANDLRDRRDLLLREIADFIDVSAFEASNGAVSILVGSDYLVFANQSYKLDVVTSVDRDILVSEPVFAHNLKALDLRSGKLKGLLDARDAIAVDYLDSLNLLANTMIFEFNRIHSTGIGLTGISSVTSVYGVAESNEATVPLAVNSRVTEGGSKDRFIDSSLAGLGLPRKYFNGLYVLFTGGDNQNHRRLITGFDPITGAIFLDGELPREIAVGDTYTITSLPFAIRNGSFDLNIRNETTGQVRTFNIPVDLDRVPPNLTGDSTLTSVRDAINNTLVAAGITGVRSSITIANELRIESTTPSLTFYFSNDTSGFLASIGLNTFFTGRDATDIAVNEFVDKNLNLIATARSPVPGDNTNALALAGLKDAKLLEDGTASIFSYYQGLVGTLGVETAQAKFRMENQQLLTTQVENQRQRISGVNLDEEVVNMIQCQRAFQAAARFISTVDNMLSVLMNAF